MNTLLSGLLTAALCFLSLATALLGQSTGVDQSLPQLVARSSGVQVAKGEVIDFEVVATFPGRDGASYSIALDEQELPDGFAVVDTGDRQQTIGADGGVSQLERYYRLRADQPGVWVLPAAQLLKASATKPVAQSSAIYTVIIAQKGTVVPFFRLLPPQLARDDAGQPLAFYQISAPIVSWQLSWQKFALILGLIACVAGLYWLILIRGHEAVPAVAKSPLTLADLRRQLQDCSGSLGSGALGSGAFERSREGYDTVQRVLMTYADQFLGQNLRAVLPAELGAAIDPDTGFSDAHHVERFIKLVQRCASERFRPVLEPPGNSAEGADDATESESRDQLRQTLREAEAVLLEPAPKESPVADALTEQGAVS